MDEGKDNPSCSIEEESEMSREGVESGEIVAALMTRKVWFEETAVEWPVEKLEGGMSCIYERSISMRTAPCATKQPEARSHHTNGD